MLAGKHYRNEGIYTATKKQRMSNMLDIKMQVTAWVSTGPLSSE